LPITSVSTEKLALPSLVTVNCPTAEVTVFCCVLAYADKRVFQNGCSRGTGGTRGSSLTGAMKTCTKNKKLKREINLYSLEIIKVKQFSTSAAKFYPKFPAWASKAELQIKSKKQVTKNSLSLSLYVCKIKTELQRNME